MGPKSDSIANDGGRSDGRTAVRCRSVATRPPLKTTGIGTRLGPASSTSAQCPNGRTLGLRVSSIHRRLGAAASLGRVNYVNQNRDSIRLFALGANHGLTALSFVVALVGASDEVAGAGPRIVAINNAGSEFVIQQFTSMRKAKKALEPRQSELDRIGSSAWSKAHKLPSDFDTWG